MRDIDWSQAPERATHVGLTLCGKFRVWYDLKTPTVAGKDYYFLHSDGRWVSNPGKPAYIPHPRPGQKEKDMTFKEMKFRVRNSKHSKMIQMKLFELGYKWDFSSGVSYQDQPYLYTTKGGSIMYSSKIKGAGYFESVQAEEMVIQPHTTYALVKAPVTVKPETVELNGKTYLKADLEAALAKLQPVK